MRRKRQYHWAAAGCFLAGFAIPGGILLWIAAIYFYTKARRLD